MLKRELKDRLAAKEAEIAKLRAALELPLLFYTADWSEPTMARWLEITGTTQATTKIMCDHIRKAFAEDDQKMTRKRPLKG
jgi:hypothetical protein